MLKAVVVKMEIKNQKKTSVKSSVATKKVTEAKTSKKRKVEEKEKESSGKDKKKRQKKDKNAPKRGTTGFMAYSNSIRSTIQAQNPGMKITDVSKEIGAKWKLLTAEEKIPFDEIAKKDKLRYEAEMKIYKQKGGSEPADASEESS